jgi:hypothetical protein
MTDRKPCKAGWKLDCSTIGAHLCWMPWKCRGATDTQLRPRRFTKQSRTTCICTITRRRIVRQPVPGKLMKLSSETCGRQGAHVLAWWMRERWG